MHMRWILAAALLAAVILPFKAAAHEDHAHKFMGTVSVVEEAQLELKTTDGKTVLFLLDAKTTFQRGKAKVDGKDLKVGERIVVSALEVTTGKTMTAQIVQLPAR